MASQFLNFLSRDLTTLFETGLHSDISIQIGREPDNKVYHLHQAIICLRSGYFANVLSPQPAYEGSKVSAKEYKENMHSSMNFDEIRTDMFDVVLRYIYGGVFPFENFSNAQLLDLLALADDLIIADLVEFLDNYISSKSDYVKQHFAAINQFSLKHPNATELNELCENIYLREPTAVFHCEDFGALPVEMVVQILENEGLHRENDEIEIFERVKEWGIAQLPYLPNDVSQWTLGQFGEFREQLEKCLPHIRFPRISARDFYRKVVPFRKILSNKQLDEILRFYLDPEDSSLRSQAQLNPLSNLLTVQNVEWISDCIHHTEGTDREIVHQIKYKLLLRGTRDGFAPKKFHELCDENGATVVIFKIEDTDRLIGGYNPTNWTSMGQYESTEKSFIFSLGNDDFDDYIYSEVKIPDKAIGCFEDFGPIFGKGGDLLSKNDKVLCAKGCYELAILPGRDWHTIKEYEVFRVVKH